MRAMGKRREEGEEGRDCNRTEKMGRDEEGRYRQAEWLPVYERRAPRELQEPRGPSLVCRKKTARGLDEAGDFHWHLVHLNKSKIQSQHEVVHGVGLRVKGGGGEIVQDFPEYCKTS